MAADLSTSAPRSARLDSTPIRTRFSAPRRGRRRPWRTPATAGSELERFAETLDLGAAALLLEPSLPRRLRRLRRPARTLDPQRDAELLHQPAHGELPVPPLAPFVLRDRPQHRP